MLPAAKNGQGHRLSITVTEAIGITAIEKSFGGARGVRALDSLTLSIPTSGVYGLLGRNGAGKSTLLRVIAGLLRADRGSVQIFGQPADARMRAKLGMLIESPSFYPFLTAREHLAMLARLTETRSDIEPVLARIGLTKAADKKVSGFSLGMKQRLGIGAALIGRPQALILDEPTNGLDPDGILEMRSLIRELAHRDGITVLLSSHLLDEVERICDRVAILQAGRLVAEGKVIDLLDREGRFFLKVDEPQALAARLGSTAEPADDGLYIRTEADEVPELIASLAASGVRIHEAKWIRPDLEAFFLSQTRGADA